MCLNFDYITSVLQLRVCNLRVVHSVITKICLLAAAGFMK